MLGGKSISALLLLGPTKKDERESALCYKKTKITFLAGVRGVEKAMLVASLGI